MTDYFDALETRSPDQRESELMASLAGQVAHAQAHSAAQAGILEGVRAADVNSREALARLPVTRKSALLERQKASRAAGGDAFGGFSALVRGPQMSRVFASPGPIYEPEGSARDYWRAGRALYAAGFRSGELVHNAFSYHMTPGAFIELSRAVQEFRPKLPIILITGHSNMLDELPPAGHDFYRLFKKPFDGPELLAAASEAVRASRF
jgi:phenylacetate-CoA ligase